MKKIFLFTFFACTFTLHQLRAQEKSFVLILYTGDPGYYDLSR
ncbi:MAG: hypothetical protein ABI472_08235 [Ginsengibacter sp.]